jgi:hypothetical protein
MNGARADVAAAGGFTPPAPPVEYFRSGDMAGMTGGPDDAPL